MAISNTTGGISAINIKDSIVKAFVSFTISAGSSTITSSKNVASITDTGTGDYTVNFSKAFSSANYCPVISYTGNSGQMQTVELGTITASSVQILGYTCTSSSNNTKAARDHSLITLMVLGDN